MWADVGALLSMLCGATCAAAGLAAAQRRAHPNQRDEEESAEMSSRLHALTAEDKAWLRAHGWNGMIRWSRRSS
jgi:hypothetical protein